MSTKTVKGKGAPPAKDAARARVKASGRDRAAGNGLTPGRPGKIESEALARFARDMRTIVFLCERPRDRSPWRELYKAAADLEKAFAAFSEGPSAPALVGEPWATLKIAKPGRRGALPLSFDGGEFVARLRQLLAALEASGEGRAGRPSAIAQRLYVSLAAEAWLRSTGEAPTDTGGPFLRALERFPLTLAGKRVKVDRDVLRRCLPAWRKYRTSDFAK